jgi:hypothetical protein
MRAILRLTFICCAIVILAQATQAGDSAARSIYQQEVVTTQAQKDTLGLPAGST